jgi:N-acetylneuraminic acid mutarotase
MQKITDWPAPPKAMWNEAGELLLAFENGLTALRNHELESLPDGGRSYRQLVGGSTVFPASSSGLPLRPLAADLFGNFWSLETGLTGTDLRVLPADAPDRWRPIPLEQGTWAHLVVDHLGFVWVAGPAGCRRFSPREPNGVFQTPVGAAGASMITALGLSPAGLAVAALDSGDLIELDIDATGQTLAKTLGHVPSATRLVHTDPQGTVWIALDDGLYCDTSHADDRHQHWEIQPGRLPGGGNHDIFSVALQDRLYVAGGLSRFWGYPTQQHVFDELFAFAPSSGRWEIISYMPFPRRYCGIATLDGLVWIVGGEGELGERGGDVTTLDLVDIYDPASGAWSQAPRLHEPHTDPFVMTAADRIWVVGGAGDDNRKLQSVESIGSGETSWRLEPELPEPAREGGCCALDGILYCGSTDGFFAFDTGTGTWDTQVPQPDKLVKAPLTTAFEDEVWMMGGARDDQTRCYNPRTRTWRIGPRLPTQQSWGGAAVLNGRLYITGGAHRSETHDMTIYDDRTWVLR